MTTPTHPWIETQATVTGCKYQFARMNTLTLGIQMQDKFRISFDYYAHGQLYSDTYQSPVAVPQNETVPIRYNPLNPRENSLSGQDTQRRSPLMLIGVVGSVMLALAWLGLLRGCS